MRNINKLLELLKEGVYYNEDPECPGELIYLGLCAVICDLCDRDKITKGEQLLLEKYLSDNRPKDCEGQDMETTLFWRPYKMFYRLRWIDKHIKLTS